MKVCTLRHSNFERIGRSYFPVYNLEVRNELVKIRDFSKSVKAARYTFHQLSDLATLKRTNLP